MSKKHIPANERGLLTCEMAADYLSISRTTFMALIAHADCIIKPHRVGVSNVRYRVSQIDEYIDSLTVAPGKCNARPDDK